MNLEQAFMTILYEKQEADNRGLLEPTFEAFVMLVREALEQIKREDGEL